MMLGKEIKAFIFQDRTLFSLFWFVFFNNCAAREQKPGVELKILFFNKIRVFHFMYNF